MDVSQWLSELFAHTEDLVELRACPNARNGGRVATLFTRDMAEVLDFLQTWGKPGYGIYVGMFTRNRHRGRAEDTVETGVAWVDVDTVAKDLVVAAAKTCRFPPSFIVDSGRGTHLYWLLNEPAGREVIETVKALCAVFNGDPSVCEPARIMRLVGTVNTKYGDERPVTVVHATGVRHDLGDLDDWLATQAPLLGAPINPFLAAATRMGLGKSVTAEDLVPGQIHNTLVRLTMKMAASGHSEDEIVAELLGALHASYGAEAWDWDKEERDIRGMIRSARTKVVVNLDERRKEKKAKEEGAPDKQHVIVAVARIALEAWERPLITVDGDLWTYEAGVWHRFDAVWEHRLRTYIQGATGALKAAPTGSTLNGAYRWIHEHPDLVRMVTWDRAGVIVGTNGAQIIDSSELLPHSPEHYATWKVACAIDPAATCPKWLSFITESVPEGVGPSLQEWMGSALIRGKSREMSKGLIIYGPSRTGKTVVTEVVRAMLGGNTCGIQVKRLSKAFGRQPLLTASGWIADDAVGMHEVLDAEGYKQIVTGERTSVERKNKTDVEIGFDLPVLLTMNNFPVVRDDSDAVYNRTGVIPMTRVWPEDEAIPLLGQAIAAEELAGVLNWALAGLVRLRERGRFDFPESMVLAGKEFRGMNSPIDEFLEQCVEGNPKKYVLRTDFARLYNDWAKLEIGQERPMSGRALGPALLKNGRYKVVGSKIHGGHRVWVGVAFTEPVLHFESAEFGRTRSTLKDLNQDATPEMYEHWNRGSK